MRPTKFTAYDEDACFVQDSGSQAARRAFSANTRAGVLKTHYIIWLLHNLVETSFDLFRYLLLGDQLIP